MGLRAKIKAALPVIVLCLYGFFKEFKPSEPFLNPFLTHNRSDPTNPGKGFSNSVLEEDVYPIWTYSYLVASVGALLLSDVLVYKPVIILESLAYLSTRVLLLWGSSLGLMKLMQLLYGIATGTEVAYYAYIYIMIDKRHFKVYTSFTRAAVLLGRSISGYLGQLLYSTSVLNLEGLHYFSLASILVASLFSLLLPNPPRSLCSCYGQSTCPRNFKTNIKKHINCAFADIKQFYCNLHLLKWSVWWAIATCGMLQVGNFVQSLWTDIAAESDSEVTESNSTAHKQQKLYNGLVVATDTLVGAGAALTVSVLRVNWSLWGEIVLGIISLADCGFLFVASIADSLWLAYICQILFRGTYSFLITIASVEISCQVLHRNYGLIFGINMTVALFLETILTIIVTDKIGLHLDARIQFKVYSFYYYVLAVIFVFSGIYKLTSTGWKNSCKPCWIPKESKLHRDDSDSSLTESKSLLEPSQANQID